jgi:hypothetical protein
VSPSGIDAAEPAIAAAADGTVYLLWVEHSGRNEADIMIRQYDSAGNPKSESVRVNPVAGQAKAWYGDPPNVKVGEDGAIYVGWTAKVEGSKGSATILYLSVSRDGGRSFSSPVKVNDDAAPASHGMHSLGVDNAGRVYFAWLDERYLNAQNQHAAEKPDSYKTHHFEKTAFFYQAKPNENIEPNAELYFAVSHDGGKTFSPNKKLASDVCPCCKTSLLTASDGRIYISWRQVLEGDLRHIAVASSIDSGNSFSQPVIVSDDQWEISACPVSGAALTEGSNKTIKIAWFTAGKAGKQGIYWSESKDAGKTFSPRMLVSENSIGGTPKLITDKAGRTKIIWAETGRIMTADLSEEKLNIENKREIAAGDLPQSVFSGDKSFISFVEKDRESRRVKLAGF